jgi:hypothetical protein
VTFKTKSGYRVSSLATNRLLQLPEMPPPAEPPLPASDRSMLLAATLPLLFLSMFLLVIWLTRSPVPHPPLTSAFAPDPPPPSDPVSVAEVAPAPVTLIPPRREGLQWRGMEITQGIQVFNEPELPACQPGPDHPHHIFCNNSVPLVAGRRTMVRVYLTCGQTCIDTTVQLRLLKGGRQKERLLQQTTAADLTRLGQPSMIDLRRKLANSLNFEIFDSPDWLSGEITFELTVTPHNGGLPLTFGLTRNFTQRAALQVAYLPLEYQGVLPAGAAEAGYWLPRTFPMPNLTYTQLPVPPLVWQGSLQKSELLRHLLIYWYYAQAAPPDYRPDQLFGWLPEQAYNGGASDPAWCPACAGPHSGRVAFGGQRPELDIGGARILAHELAHNLGAQHAWSPTSGQDAACFRSDGTDINVDPAWPYPHNAHIQEVGVDLYSDPPVIYDPTSNDIMAYCARPWISPHTYLKLFDSPLLRPQPAPRAAGTAVVLVTGLIQPGGKIPEFEVMQLPAAMFLDGLPEPVIPPAGVDYCVTLETGQHRPLARHCFAVDFSPADDYRTVEPAAFFLALPVDDPAQINKIALTKGGSDVAVADSTGGPPQVRLTFPTTGQPLKGQQTITWEASDPDGDSLRYDLFYSPDGGRYWLPLAIRLTRPYFTFAASQILPSPNLLLRVVARDGFFSTIAQTEIALPTR